MSQKIRWYGVMRYEQDGEQKSRRVTDLLDRAEAKTALLAVMLEWKRKQRTGRPSLCRERRGSTDFAAWAHKVRRAN